jgi:Recombinase zinc beta ribbon domain
MVEGLCAHRGKRFRAQKQVRSRVSAYYVCGGCIDSGVTVCNAPRVPVLDLEEAVLT